MNLVAALSPQSAASAVERFLLVMGRLLDVVGARRGRDLASAPLIRAAYNKLGDLAVRFAVLALNLRKRRAGTLPATGRERAPSRPPASPPDKTSRKDPQPRLPTSFGWLIDLIPEAVCFADLFRDRLSDPEFVALLTAYPSLQRALRPLARMLGVELPDFPPPLPPPEPPPSEIRAPSWSVATDPRSLATMDDRTLALAIARLKPA
jgi:hypothetical protein